MSALPHNANPDLHKYRRGVHKAVLLDEARDGSFILNNKKLLQAHIDGAILRQSATQRFAWEIMLWKVPILVTTNKWSPTGFDEADQDRLEANCVAVGINEPVWQVEAPVQASQGRARRPVTAVQPSAPSPQHKFPSRP